MRRYLIFSDVHVPFHDEECLNTIYQVAKDKQFGIDEIVINGDFFDMYNVNSHGPKHPEVRETLGRRVLYRVHPFRTIEKRES